jgi:hypothetical protein
MPPREELPPTELPPTDPPAPPPLPMEVNELRGGRFLAVPMVANDDMRRALVLPPLLLPGLTPEKGRCMVSVLRGPMVRVGTASGLVCSQGRFHRECESTRCTLNIMVMWAV